MAETKKTAEQLYAQAQEAQKQLEQLQAQQPGAYESSYGAQIDALMAQLDSRPGFTYDVNGDPLYRQYAEQYQRQGKAAMEDILGAAAGLTGGYGSSYATTAASQAYQQYLSGMQDVAPALYAAAYARYQDEGTALEKQLERLQGLESNAYGVWQAQVQANQAAQAQALDYWRYLNDAAYQAQQDEQAQANWQQEFNAKYPPVTAAVSGGGGSRKSSTTKDTVSDVLDRINQVTDKVQSAAKNTVTKRKTQQTSKLFRPVSK